MNNIQVCNSRNRNVDSKMFSPINFSITNYSTDAQSKAMKNAFGDTLLLNNISSLHLIPDPLKKNLADSVLTGNMEQRIEPDKFERPPSRTDSFTTLGGISNFFSGVFNIMSAMFQKREPSPTTQYYDCFDALDDGEMSPSLAWHNAKLEVQNKNEQAPDTNDNSDTMSVVTKCEEKLNQIRSLLNNNSKNHKQRSEKIFVEPGSIEESFEETFYADSIDKLANETQVKCYGAYNHQEHELLETDAPFVKTELIKESMDIVMNLPECIDNKDNQIDNKKQTSIDNKSEAKQTQFDEIRNLEPMSNIQEKHQIISSCEDKMNKLKDLLCKRRDKSNLSTNELATSPIPIKEVIPSSFGNEIGSNDSSTTKENSFDEVNGRFYSSSIDSDDSFQIVFSDRKRIPSDCESEDSFIVFEESPDSCYTSNDVFGSDSESDMEEDSGYVKTCKLNHSMSRTFGDLTDDSLYSADVVDSVGCLGEEVDAIDSLETTLCAEPNVGARSGLLVDDRRKREKRKEAPKKVRFSPNPPKVHVMRVWAFAARQARAGHWERHALDRERFRRRIADVDVAISWVLKPQHRSRVMFQRFMPWWNAQKRQELAEKKALEEKEKCEKIQNAKVEFEKTVDDLKEDGNSESVVEDNEENYEKANGENAMDSKQDVDLKEDIENVGNSKVETEGLEVSGLKPYHRKDVTRDSERLHINKICSSQEESLKQNGLKSEEGEFSEDVSINRGSNQESVGNDEFKNIFMDRKLNVSELKNEKIQDRNSLDLGT